MALQAYFRIMLVDFLGLFACVFGSLFQDLANLQSLDIHIIFLVVCFCKGLTIGKNRLFI